MLRFIRIIAGADPQFDEHLKGVLDVYLKAFEFYPDYAAKIAARRMATIRRGPKR